MRNIDKLKMVLKETASQIRTVRYQFKQAQRTGASCDITYRLLIQLRDLQRLYRHHHIAYCELRGKLRKDIEHKNRENNQPDEAYINKIKAEYAWTPDEIQAYKERYEEALCAS